MCQMELQVQTPTGRQAGTQNVVKSKLFTFVLWLRLLSSCMCQMELQLNKARQQVGRRAQEAAA
jgi:hypothetical protein